ncbi:hypothetical protein LIA77_00108 [Sarocladium implicatum]|nr:hypothetical protein LIA77_00108 [Sarocladium implicatum]
MGCCRLMQAMGGAELPVIAAAPRRMTAPVEQKNQPLKHQFQHVSQWVLCASPSSLAELLPGLPCCIVTVNRFRRRKRAGPWSRLAIWDGRSRCCQIMVYSSRNRRSVARNIHIDKVSNQAYG